MRADQKENSRNEVVQSLSPSPSPFPRSSFSSSSSEETRGGSCGDWAFSEVRRVWGRRIFRLFKSSCRLQSHSNEGAIFRDLGGESEDLVGEELGFCGRGEKVDDTILLLAIMLKRCGSRWISRISYSAVPSTFGTTYFLFLVDFDKQNTILTNRYNQNYLFQLNIK